MSDVVTCRMSLHVRIPYTDELEPSPAGAAIRQARAMCLWTAERCAKSVCVSRQTWYDWESGGRPMSPVLWWWFRAQVRAWDHYHAEHRRQDRARDGELLDYDGTDQASVDSASGSGRGETF